MNSLPNTAFTKRSLVQAKAVRVSIYTVNIYKPYAKFY